MATGTRGTLPPATTLAPAGGWARWARAVAATVLACGASPLLAQSDEGRETVTVAPLAPATPYRLYVADVAIPHIVDGKLHIIDGAAMKYQGTIATGFAGNGTLSPDRGELYIATTYLSKLNRGERVDQVDVYDARTLALTGEIALPPKHAQALPYRGLVRTSADGRWLFVQNATPATSVSIVDLKARKFVTEVQTPGCWAVLTVPAEPMRFTTICGDGSLLTISLDNDGNVTGQKRAQKFFDADNDPIFVHAEYDGDQVHFISFKGRLHTARLAGEQASFDAPKPLVPAADAKAGWRPGGYQPIALHADSKRLFIAMHPAGKEGSHKEPAREIWVYDLGAMKRTARVPGSAAIALAVTRGDKPLLFAIDGAKNALVSWDVQRSPKLRPQRHAPMGDSATLIEVQ